MKEPLDEITSLDQEQIRALVNEIDEDTLGQAMWAASPEVYAVFKEHLPVTVRQFAESERRFQGDLAERYFPGNSPAPPPLASMANVEELTEREIQTTLREVSLADLALALVGAPAGIRTKILENMSREAGSRVEAEVQSRRAAGQDQIATAQGEFLRAAARVCPGAVSDARAVVAKAMEAQERVANIWRRLSGDTQLGPRVLE